VIDFNKDDTTTTNTGQAILAIDLSAFGDVDAFKARVDKLVQELRSSERMPDVDRIWLPGEQSQQRRIDNARDGVPLPLALIEKLDDFALSHAMPALRDIH
jgi:LDH2 family malate/lactate/ureidoglycolate dehydrogenase